jgi:N-acetylneuraminate synthase
MEDYYIKMLFLYILLCCYVYSIDIKPIKQCVNCKNDLTIEPDDFGFYEKLISPDLFEFHLSYSDMDLYPGNYLQGPYTADFVVHAPELFSQSRLMDLASRDEEYREFSIKETQRVINITKSLKVFFPSSSRPLIVANIGGFSMDTPLSDSDVCKSYENFADSLRELDMEGVEIIPQTMAPFPWHFGGQRYQNLFLGSEQIIHWCEKLGLRMCFDVSHSFLACNHLGVDFYDFAKRVAPFTAHLHLGDARGLNGEGLQIGSGDIDFQKLCRILDRDCPNASFIPEIWQGHKNSGEGFWIALDSLERYMK